MSKALYVHIPFCRSICAYCDFCRVFYEASLAESYLDAMEKEAKKYQGQKFETVYIGGGTPSSLSEEQFERLLTILKPFASEAKEYTVEINPETLNERKAELLISYGVNRVSLGVQSFQKRLLAMMERRHTYDDVVNSVQLLRKAGIMNISCDLLYGLPTQSIEEFMDSLRKCVELSMEHISFYMLTIEPHSKFARLHYETQSEELSDEMYFQGISYLEENGYAQYEISNFARKGYESKHNKVYWHYEDYAALGMGASGKENGIRYTNTSNFVKYFRGEYVEEETILDEESLNFETVMMGLRLKEGIDIPEDLYQYYREVIERLVQEGKLEYSNHHLRCVGENYYLLNEILIDFIRN